MQPVPPAQAHRGCLPNRAGCQRNRLLARRNQVRDSQLEFLLQALAPLEQVDAPTTTADQLTNTHNDAMQRAHVRSLALNAMALSTCLGEFFRHAEV